MKTVSAPIQIDAPPMTVWRVLTDLGRYQDWNPLIREASGEVAVGKRIRLLSVQPATGRMMTVKPKIVAVEPGVELRWVSSLLGLIGGEHSFALSPAEGAPGWSRARGSGALWSRSPARRSPVRRPVTGHSMRP